MTHYPSEVLDYRDPNDVIMMRGNTLQGLYRAVQTWHLDDSVRVVRGNRMTTWRSLFDEFSAAFQFPLYFGGNFDAFLESLSEPDQEPIAGPRVCIISGVEDVLAEEADGAVARFVRILGLARGNWSTHPPEHLDGVVPVFSTVIVPYDKSVAVHGAWSAAGASITELWVDADT
jgi:hypothetical protein